MPSGKKPAARAARRSLSMSSPLASPLMYTNTPPGASSRWAWCMKPRWCTTLLVRASSSFGNGSKRIESKEFSDSSGTISCQKPSIGRTPGRSATSEARNFRITPPFASSMWCSRTPSCWIDLADRPRP